MADTLEPVDFDVRPPMPVTEYEHTVTSVNVGYDLLFTLTDCFLRALGRPELHLLVVGAGGGAEIARFMPEQPGWRLTGVDPSRDMLALAQATAERLGVSERVTLVQGTVADLSTSTRFDAATCLYVLHFLPDADKLALLRGIAERLQPEAPLLIASGGRAEHADMLDDFRGAWQQYGVRMGMPRERMTALIEQLLVRQAQTPTEAGYARLLREAGFRRVAPYFSVMNGGTSAWIAR